MAVTLYTGHVGSGKSYEVVKFVILPALAQGRSVVSNIDGLNTELIREHLSKQGVEEIGDLIVVDRDEVRRPDFFPKRQADGSYKPSSFVPLGALVVIDEAPAVWGADKSILPAHQEFFREHRHIVSPDGIASDLCVISQTPMDLHRVVKGLVEFSVDCRQLKALGMTSKYSTVTYSGARRAGKYVMARNTRAYDKSIFPLYKSFSQKHATVLATDKRFSIWNSKGFWAMVVVAPLVFGFATYRLYASFFGGSHLQAVPSPATVATALAAVTPGSVASSGAAGVASHVLPSPPPAPAVPARSDRKGFGGGPDEWQLVGAARFNGMGWAVLRRDGYPLRYLPLASCQMSFGVPVLCRDGLDVYQHDASSSASAGASGGSTWAVDRAAAKSVKK